jgi:hypothetical protein
MKGVSANGPDAQRAQHAARENPETGPRPYRVPVIEAAPIDALVKVAEQVLPLLRPPHDQGWHAEIGNTLQLMLANTEGTIARLQELRVPLRKSVGHSFDHETMISLDARCRLAIRILDSVRVESDLSPQQRLNLSRLLHELPQAALRLAGYGCAVYPAVAVALLAAVGIAALFQQGAVIGSTLETCANYFRACVDPAHDGSLADNAEVRATAVANLHYAMEGMPKFGFLGDEQVAGAAPSAAWRSSYGIVSGSAEAGYTGRVETEVSDRANPRGWAPFPGFGDTQASLDPIIGRLSELRVECMAELEEERILRRHCEVVTGLVREIDALLARL